VDNRWLVGIERGAWRKQKPYAAMPLMPAHPSSAQVNNRLCSHSLRRRDLCEDKGSPCCSRGGGRSSPNNGEGSGSGCSSDSCWWRALALSTLCCCSLRPLFISRSLRLRHLGGATQVSAQSDCIQRQYGGEMAAAERWQWRSVANSVAQRTITAHHCIAFCNNHVIRSAWTAPNRENKGIYSFLRPPEEHSLTSLIRSTTRILVTSRLA